MQIDLEKISILVSIAVGICTIFTVLKSNAKNQAEAAAKQEEINGKIDLVQNDIKHLDAKVEKHNKVIERTYELETKVDVLKEEMKVEQHRTQDLEEGLEKVNDKLINTTRRNGI